MFRYRLDDQVGVAQLGQPDGEPDPAEQLVPPGFGQLAPGHRPVGGAGERGPAALQGGLGDLDGHHIEAGAGEYLNDPGTHGAHADHADAAELPGHAALPNACSVPVREVSHGGVAARRAP